MGVFLARADDAGFVQADQRDRSLETLRVRSGRKLRQLGGAIFEGKWAVDGERVLTAEMAVGIGVAIASTSAKQH